jgi:hypothetical protein
MFLKPGSHKFVKLQVFLIFCLLAGYILSQLEGKQIKEHKIPIISPTTSLKEKNFDNALYKKKDALFS